MLNFIATQLRQRQAVRELSGLSDRELADLGIARSDIKAVVGSALISREELHAAGKAMAARSSEWVDTMAPSWANHNRRSLIA